MNIQDYTGETKNKLFYVSEQILSKVELSNYENIWFKPNIEKISSQDFGLAIKKLGELQLLKITDERNYVEDLWNPTTYKLSVNSKHLREFTHEIKRGKKVIDNNPNAYWPDYYRWDESGLNFQVGDGKVLNFQSKNTRWKIFNSLVSRKGDAVLVATMEEESESKNTVRVVINQIIEKIAGKGLSKYLKIEPLGKDKAGIRGAYRIIVPT